MENNKGKKKLSLQKIKVASLNKDQLSIAKGGIYDTMNCNTQFCNTGNCYTQGCHTHSNNPDCQYMTQACRTFDEITTCFGGGF